MSTKCRAPSLLPCLPTGSLATGFSGCSTGPRQEDPFADWASSFLQQGWLLKHSVLEFLQLLE